MQFCDECGEELVFTGDVLLTDPAKYVHKCNKCGNIEWFSKSYPCIEYR
jgi:DNA-directed RNA polymerase subunit M/transcription elongation factor TFIIS